jgi:type IV pilus assembly protein PilW
MGIMNNRLSYKGLAFIELLVALVLFGMVVAGIYRLFIAQNTAYVVQDQVVEVQQNIRSAMEILLRDIRMAGFDDDNAGSAITITNPIVYPVSGNSITVNYEYYDKGALQYQRHTVAYWLDVPSSSLFRQPTVDNVAGPQEVLLENVEALSFTYGADQNGDGVMDDLNGNGVIDDGDWIPAANVGTRKVIAVRVTLAARPAQVNPEVQKIVIPRTLTSAITLRNLCLTKL